MKRALLPLLVVALATIGCSLDQPPVPALTGPSGLGLSVTVTASPDALLQDGATQSVVAIAVLDAGGQPVAGQSFLVQTRGVQTHGGAATPNVGTLAVTSVATNGLGNASVVFTSPTPDAGDFSFVTVEFVPVGNGNGALTRTVSIRMVRPVS